MASSEKKVEYKEIEEVQVALTRIHGNIEDLPKVFNRLKDVVGKSATGNFIVVHHWGVSDDKGHDMDVCLPSSKVVDFDRISTVLLPSREAMTMTHRGSYSDVGKTYQKVFSHTYERGHPVAESTREVFMNLDLDNPKKTVVEVQAVLHDWTERLSNSLERVLGKDLRDSIMEPMKSLDFDTLVGERHEALCQSLQRLENSTIEEQQFEILSHCAHVFPVELIPPMRELYKKTKNIDAVIDALKETGGYYPKLLRREGNIIYSEKGPANQTAYKEAKTPEEKRKAYCFCPLIRNALDETPEVFCNCAAGWPKQLWEGIFEKPVSVDIVRSLTKGDDACEFAIHLPDSVTVE